MRSARAVTIGLILALALGSMAVARAQVPAADDAIADGRTPPRLSFVDGQASFWRPGAPDWVAAQTNTALAPGDELYTGSPGNVELQIGARAFVRAWAATSLGEQRPARYHSVVQFSAPSVSIRTTERSRSSRIAPARAASRKSAAQKAPYARCCFR